MMNWLKCGIFLLTIAVASAGEEKAEFKFKPAQGSLAAVAKGLADGLEHHGSPVPYLRHVLSEHERIHAKYRDKMKREAAVTLPEWLNDDYIKKTERGWAKLSPAFELDQFSRKTGKRLNSAIAVRNGFLVEMLNAYQTQTFDMMTSNGKTGDYSGLKSEILARLKSKSVIDHAVRVEIELSAEMAKLYREFMGLERFRKSDFSNLERFYSDKNGRDVLSDLGKNRMSRRVAAGTDHDIPGALTADRKHFAKVMEIVAPIEEDLQLIYRAADGGLPEEQATIVKSWIAKLIDEVAEAAHSELMVAILEWGD